MNRSDATSSKAKQNNILSEKLGRGDHNLKDMGNRVVNSDKLSLCYNERNLIKFVEFSNLLSGTEKEELAKKVRQQLQKYHHKAMTDFDSSKNWSIMISKEWNDERNQIMRRFKYEHKRRHKLPEFSRQQRDRILSSRCISQQQTEDDAKAIRPSTSAALTHSMK